MSTRLLIRRHSGYKSDTATSNLTVLYEYRCRAECPADFERFQAAYSYLFLGEPNITNDSFGLPDIEVHFYSPNDLTAIRKEMRIFCQHHDAQVMLETLALAGDYKGERYYLLD